MYVYNYIHGLDLCFIITLLPRISPSFFPKVFVRLRSDFFQIKISTLQVLHYLRNEHKVHLEKNPGLEIFELHTRGVVVKLKIICFLTFFLISIPSASPRSLNTFSNATKTTKTTGTKIQ